jgi:hypothetical protein
MIFAGVSDGKNTISKLSISMGGGRIDLRRYISYVCKKELDQLNLLYLEHS